MLRPLLLVLALFTGAGVAFGQNAAAAVPAGDAYYEFLNGLQLEASGDTAGAVAAFERAQRLDPQSAEIPAALAELYARSNRPSEAIAAGERALAIDPSNATANWILGAVYARMSEMPTTSPADRQTYTRRAIETLDKADRNAHPGVPMMLGRLYISDRQFDKATALLTSLVEENPDQIEAVALLAMAYQESDREAEAIALLERYVQDAPELYSTLAQAYQNAGRWTDAARAFEGAVEERPRNLALRSQWATALLNAGDAERAREALEAGSAGNSRSTQALYLLSEAQRRTRDYAAAEVTARRLMALDPGALGGPRQLAQIFRDQGAHQKIVALLEPIVTERFRTADVDDFSSDAFRSVYFDLASAYEAQRQFDKSIALLTRARAMSPDEPLVHIRLSRAQEAAERHGDAISTLEAAVARFPNRPGVKLSLGALLERRNRFDEAEAVFRDMIAANPNDADALNSLGYMFAERGEQLDEAVSLLQRALAIDPGNGAYLDSLGWAYYKQNRFDLAEAPLRDAARLLPRISVIQSHLGDLLNRRGQFAEAIEAWQKALEGDGDDVSRSELERKIRSARQKLGR